MHSSGDCNISSIQLDFLINVIYIYLREIDASLLIMTRRLLLNFPIIKIHLRIISKCIFWKIEKTQIWSNRKDEEARADVRIRITFEEFVKIGNFIDGSIVVSPGISRVNHWWPYLKRPHTTHGHGFEHVRDRLVDDRAFFAFSVDSPLYLRRKSCYRTSVPASFMITSDTLVPWRWKNAHENWSRRAFPIKFCRSFLTIHLLSSIVSSSFSPLLRLLLFRIFRYPIFRYR